ncbi:MAG: hypothetical protein ABW189_07670 [Rickettsiales bacterium]
MEEYHKILGSRGVTEEQLKEIRNYCGDKTQRWEWVSALDDSLIRDFVAFRTEPEYPSIRIFCQQYDALWQWVMVTLPKEKKLKIFVDLMTDPQLEPIRPYFQTDYNRCNWWTVDLHDKNRETFLALRTEKRFAPIRDYCREYHEFWQWVTVDLDDENRETFLALRTEERFAPIRDYCQEYHEFWEWVTADLNDENRELLLELINKELLQSICGANFSNAKRLLKVPGIDLMVTAVSLEIWKNLELMDIDRLKEFCNTPRYVTILTEVLLPSPYFPPLFLQCREAFDFYVRWREEYYAPDEELPPYKKDMTNIIIGEALRFIQTMNDVSGDQTDLEQTVSDSTKKTIELAICITQSGYKIPYTPIELLDTLQKMTLTRETFAAFKREWIKDNKKLSGQGFAL